MLAPVSRSADYARVLPQPQNGVITIRLARPTRYKVVPSETWRLRRFYKNNPDKGVYVREPRVVRQAVNDGLYVVGTQRKKWFGIPLPVKRLIGGAAVYPVPGTPDKELGSVRGIAPGSGLHGVLYAVASNLAFLHDNPPLARLTCDVQQRMGKVNELVSSEPVKWTRFEPDASFVNGFKTTVTASDTNVDTDKFYYHCPVSRLPVKAALLLRIAETGYHINPKGNRVPMKLDFDQNLMDGLRAIVANRAFFERLPDDTPWQKASSEFKALINWKSPPPPTGLHSFSRRPPGWLVAKGGGGRYAEVTRSPS